MCMFMFMHFNHLSMLFVKPDFCQKMLWSICATVDINKYVYRKTFIKDCLQISLPVLSKFRRINNFIFPLKSLDISSWVLTAFLNFLTGSFFKGCNYSKRIFLKKIEIFSVLLPIKLIYVPKYLQHSLYRSNFKIIYLYY